MALALDWGGVAETDLAFSDFFGIDHTLVVRFLPQYTYAGDGPLLGATGNDVFEFGLGVYPGVNGVRVTQPLVRLAVDGNSSLYESAVAMAPAQTFEDFESGSYRGWTATGTCFGSVPSSGTLPNQNPVVGFFGRGVVNTFLNGDAATGTLTSPSFNITRPFIRFLIGGGRHPGRCCLNLVANGNVVRTETGQHTEQLDWVCWDVRSLIGTTAQLQIVDVEAGPWGRVLVDHIEFADTPLLLPRLWQELALVRTLSEIWNKPVYIPYLNGEKLGPAFLLTPNWAPAGDLRIGGHGRPGAVGQFYGLVDEVAVYRRSLTQQELRVRAWSPKRMTGTEPRLLAGWTFQSPAPPQTKLRRPLALQSAASIVTTTPGQDSGLDAAKLPTHARAVRAWLPLPLGEEWAVVQGFDERRGTHAGYASFCWDFGRDGATTVDAPVYATAVGDVAMVVNNDLTDNFNRVEVAVAPDEFHTHYHMRAGAAKVSTGNTVTPGQQVSQVGGLDHLHFACANVLHDATGFTTRAMGFAFFEHRTPGGPWNPAEFGMPIGGEHVRRGWWRLHNGKAFPRAYATAIARAETNLDVFVARADGSVHTAGWDTQGWRGWWEVGSASAVAGAPVHGVSRSRDKLDIFITDLTGRITTAAWEPGFASWSAWRPVAGGISAAGSPVTAVTRSIDKLDVFVVGTDNHVYTAAWEHGDIDWRGWWGIGTARAPFTTPVHAVSRSTDKLDIFMTDENGVIMTAAWEPGSAGWRGWWEIAGGRAAPGSPVTAVSRSSDKLDVFVVGTDNHVYTAAWEPGQGGWRGWWIIGDVSAPAAAPVHAVVRGPDKLDIFVTDVDGVMRTAAWQPTNGWRGWWSLPGNEAVPGAPLFPVTRSTDRLDVFAVGRDFRASTTGWQPGATSWEAWTDILP